MGHLLQPDFSFGGIQGGASPYKVEQDADTVAVDLTAQTRRISSSARISSTCGARRSRNCQKRFEGQMPHYKTDEKSGGLGCFTPDNFPVFDVFRENV